MYVLYLHIGAGHTAVQEKYQQCGNIAYLLLGTELSRKGTQQEWHWGKPVF